MPSRLTVRPLGKIATRCKHRKGANRPNKVDGKSFRNVKIRSRDPSHWISDAPRKVQKQEGPAF